MTGNRTSWLTVAGKSDGDLEAVLAQEVASKIAAGRYTVDNVAYISKVHLNLEPGYLQVSDKTLEKLRRLCQLWDVDIRATNITSHRKVIGPLIVAAKKIVYPLLKVFLKDFIRQQRSFNAAVIALLAEVSQKPKNDPAADSRDKHE
jgi:hypothetical protein